MCKEAVKVARDKIATRLEQLKRAKADRYDREVYLKGLTLHVCGSGDLLY
jgi:hypothetical protein